MDSQIVVTLDAADDITYTTDEDYRCHAAKVIRITSNIDTPDAYVDFYFDGVGNGTWTGKA